MATYRNCTTDKLNCEDSSKLNVVAGGLQPQGSVVWNDEVPAVVCKEEPQGLLPSEPLLDNEEEDHEVLLEVDECGDPIKKGGVQPDGELISCEHCGKSFNSRAYLKIHIRSVHLGLKPYVCKDCGKAFSRTSLLTEHKRLHSNNLPFVCNQCNRRFRWKSSLQLHMQTHNDVQSFACPHCPERFRWRISLRRHMTDHSKTAAHVCNVCGKTFRDAYGLNQHNRVHTGERPFSCPECKRTFRWKHQVGSHACSGSVEDVGGASDQTASARSPSVGRHALPVDISLTNSLSREAHAEEINQAALQASFHFVGAKNGPSPVTGAVTSKLTRALPATNGSSLGVLPRGVSCLVNGMVVAVPPIAIYNRSPILVTDTSKRSQTVTSSAGSGHYLMLSDSTASNCIEMSGTGSPFFGGNSVTPSSPQLHRAAENSCTSSSGEREHLVASDDMPRPKCLKHRRQSSVELDHCYSKPALADSQSLDAAVPPRTVRQSTVNSTPSCEVTRLRHSQYDMPGPPVVTVLSDGSVRTSSGEKRRLSPALPAAGKHLCSSVETRQACHRITTTKVSTPLSGSNNSTVLQPVSSEDGLVATSVSATAQVIVTPSSSTTQPSTETSSVSDQRPPQWQRANGSVPGLSTICTSNASLEIKHKPTLLFTAHPLPDVQLGKPVMF